MIAFIGVHSGGRSGRPVSQSETLAALFAAEGYRTVTASSAGNAVLRTLHQLWVAASARSIDVCVVDVFSGPSFRFAELVTAVCRARRIPVVLFLHGGNLPAFAPLHRDRVERLLARAAVIAAPSGYQAATFEEWGHQVVVIPNVVDLAAYDFVERSVVRPRLLWMRTFHEHYAPEVAVRVLARVRERHGDAILSMGGADQGRLAATEAAIGDFGVGEWVRLLGYLDGAGKRAAFADHDIFLNTNVVDNMPVSVLEAGASGLVPVATSVGGLPYLITHGVDGILVEPGDADAMADEVLSLLDEPARAALLSRGARRLAEQSSWPAVHRRWCRQLALLLPELVET